MKSCGGEFGFCEFCCCCWFLQSKSESTVSKPSLSNASLTPGVGWRAMEENDEARERAMCSCSAGIPALEAGDGAE